MLPRGSFCPKDHLVLLWVVDNSYQRYSLSTGASFGLVSSIILLRLDLIDFCYAGDVDHDQLKLGINTILPITPSKVSLLDV